MDLWEFFVSPIWVIGVPLVFIIIGIVVGVIKVVKSPDKWKTISKAIQVHWVILMVIGMGIYLYLLAFSEGIIRDIIFILGAIMLLMMALGSTIGSSLGGGGWNSEKVVTMYERYRKKYKDGKPHLFKEYHPWDEDLGRLHKKFGGGEETRNILEKNYEIGDKGFYRTDRDFIKKDENEGGVLKEPNLFQSITGEKYSTYKPKKRKK